MGALLQRRHTQFLHLALRMVFYTECKVFMRVEGWFTYSIGADIVYYWLGRGAQSE